MNALFSLNLNTDHVRGCSELEKYTRKNLKKSVWNSFHIFDTFNSLDAFFQHRSSNFAWAREEL